MSLSRDFSFRIPRAWSPSAYGNPFGQAMAAQLDLHSSGPQGSRPLAVVRADVPVRGLESFGQRSGAVSRNPDAYSSARFLGVDPAPATPSRPQLVNALDLNAAREQTNARIWDAIEAEGAFLRHLQMPSHAYPGGAPQWNLEERRLSTVQSLAWNEVRFAIAYEMRVAEHAIGPVYPSGEGVISALREGLPSRFPPDYEARIDLLAQDVQPLGDAYFLTVDEAVAPYADRLEHAYATDGAVGFVDALAEVGTATAEDPFVVGDGTFALGPDLSQARANELDAALQARIAPLVERALAELPVLLEQHSASRATPDRYDPQVDSYIARVLDSATLVLPRQEIGRLMVDSQAAWAPGLAGVGDPGYPVWILEDETLATRDVFRPYARIADRLANVVDGEEALRLMGAQMAAPLAEAQLHAPLTGYASAFAEAARHGEGSALLVELSNRLATDPNTAGLAAMTLYGYDEGLREFLADVAGNVERWTTNRQEVDRLTSQFAALVDAGQAPRRPGDIDVGALELQDALDAFHASNPEVLANDEAAIRRLIQHSYALFNVEMSLAGLTPQAGALVADGRLSARLEDFYAESAAAVFSVDRNPVMAGLARDHLADILVTLPDGAREQLIAALQEGLLAAGIEPGDVVSMNDPGWFESLSTFSPEMRLARNGRGMVEKLLKLSAAQDLPGHGLLNMPATHLAGPIYLATTVIALDDLTGGDGAELNALERAFLAARGGAYGVQGVLAMQRSGTALLNQFPRLVDRANPPAVLNIQWDDGKSRFVPISDMRGLNVGLNLVHTAGYGWDLYRALRDGDNGLLVAGHGTMIAYSSLAALAAGLGSSGSITIGSTALGFGMTLTSTGIGALAGVLAMAGTLLIQHGNRVKEANRFETPDAREFFSHIGSRDDVTGRLRPLDAQTQVSDRVSHDPEVRTIEQGAPTDGEIVYRGISANAVDELMNNSGDPADPQSAAPVLAALADRHGIDTRTLIVDWYDHLTPDQQKALPEAAFGVDLQAPGRVRPEFFAIYTHQDLSNVLVALGIDGRLSADVQAEAFAYLSDHLVADHQGDLGYAYGYVYLDHAAVRAALGHGPVVAGQQMPSAPVRDALAQAYGLSKPLDLYVRTGVQFVRQEMRPTNLAELDLYLRYEQGGYPPLPAAPTAEPFEWHRRPEPAAPEPEAPVAGSPSETPAVEPTPDPTAAEPEAPRPEDLEPMVHFHQVQPGDTLWSISARSDDERVSDLESLLAFHEAHRDHRGPAFDPALIDGDPFTVGGGERDGLRDPDLIRPGDWIALPAALPATR